MSKIPVWTTAKGEKIPVTEMETSHIENALAMLRRMGYVGPREVSFYAACAGPQGEMAQVAFDQEQNYVFSAPVSDWVDIFVEELQIRKEASDVEQSDEIRPAIPF